jgi:hypothetical protein
LLIRYRLSDLISIPLRVSSSQRIRFFPPTFPIPNKQPLDDAWIWVIFIGRLIHPLTGATSSDCTAVESVRLAVIVRVLFRLLPQAFREAFP